MRGMRHLFQLSEGLNPRGLGPPPTWRLKKLTSVVVGRAARGKSGVQVISNMSLIEKAAPLTTQPLKFVLFRSE